MSGMDSSMAKEVMDEYRRRSRKTEAIPAVKIQKKDIDIVAHIDIPYSRRIIERMERLHRFAMLNTPLVCSPNDYVDIEHSIGASVYTSRPLPDPLSIAEIEKMLDELEALI